MQPSQNCIDLIKKFEGLRLSAYICPAGVPTIGWGTTVYPDGKKVKLGEKINEQRANELLMNDVSKVKIPSINVNQNQYDALVSFAYNLGTGALLDSTLLKKVRLSPNDQSIRNEFMKWTKARVNGKLVTLEGLVRRRKAEADLYFK
jgi:lysozyme